MNLIKIDWKKITNFTLFCLVAYGPLILFFLLIGWFSILIDGIVFVSAIYEILTKANPVDGLFLLFLIILYYLILALTFYYSYKYFNKFSSNKKRKLVLYFSWLIISFSIIFKSFAGVAGFGSKSVAEALLFAIIPMLPIIVIFVLLAHVIFVPYIYLIMFLAQKNTFLKKILNEKNN